MKTNTRWYPFKDMGSYFRIVDGELCGVSMLVDGTMDLVDGAPNAFFVEYIEERHTARMDDIKLFLSQAE